MPKNKRQTKKKLKGKGRINDAERWLINHPQKDIISAYSNRYNVTKDVAEEELMKLGYYDEVCIQNYENEEVEWEYRVEPLSGEMVVVPKDADDHEIYEIHGLF